MKKKRPISKNGSTTSSDSRDELSDYNNNQLKKTAKFIDDGEDADIDEEIENTTSKLEIVQKQDPKKLNNIKLQKVLECFENRRLSYSKSCYVTSNSKNNQTTSLNFCPTMKSMLII